MTSTQLAQRRRALVAPPAVDPIEDATRREFLYGLGTAAAAAAFLAACGDSEESTPTPTPTRDVIDAYGDTITIPANPERILVTDNEALPYLLELGLIPVAAGTLSAETYDGQDFYPALYDLAAGDVTPFSRDEPDYELITTFNPDVIVGATFPLENRVTGGVDTYKTIAPLVAVDSTLPTFDQIRAYGRIFDREDRAEELIAEFSQSLRALAADISIETISIARAFGDADIFIYSAAEPFTSLWVELLGVTVVPGPEVAREDVGTYIAPAERISDLGGEALIVLFGLERLEANPLWPLLPAVAAGNVYDANDYLAYTGQGGLGALQRQIEGFANFLATIE